MASRTRFTSKKEVLKGWLEGVGIGGSCREHEELSRKRISNPYHTVLYGSDSVEGIHKLTCRIGCLYLCCLFLTRRVSSSLRPKFLRSGVRIAKHPLFTLAHPFVSRMKRGSDCHINLQTLSLNLNSRAFVRKWLFQSSKEGSSSIAGGTSYSVIGEQQTTVL